MYFCLCTAQERRSGDHNFLDCGNRLCCTTFRKDILCWDREEKAGFELLPPPLSQVCQSHRAYPISPCYYCCSWTVWDIAKREKSYYRELGTSSPYSSIIVRRYGYKNTVLRRMLTTIAWREQRRFDQPSFIIPLSHAVGNLHSQRMCWLESDCVLL